MTARNVGLIAFGGILIATAWPTFGEVFDGSADEPIVSALVGGVPLVLGLLFIFAGAWGLARDRSGGA